MERNCIGRVRIDEVERIQQEIVSIINLRALDSELLWNNKSRNEGICQKDKWGNLEKQEIWNSSYQRARHIDAEPINMWVNIIVCRFSFIL